MTKWFSVREGDFGNLFFIGFGFAGTIPGTDFALIVVIAPRVICIGPHK